MHGDLVMCMQNLEWKELHYITLGYVDTSLSQTM